jgi:hypothetical protein
VEGGAQTIREARRPPDRHPVGEDAGGAEVLRTVLATILSFAKTSSASQVIDLSVLSGHNRGS